MSKKNRQLSKPITLPWDYYAPSGQAFHCPDCDYVNIDGGLASFHSILQKHQAPILKPSLPVERRIQIALMIGESMMQENKELKKYIEVLEGRLAKKENNAKKGGK